MPVYEFRCNACGIIFERLLSMSSPAEQDCLECGGTAVRIISRTTGLVKDSTPGNYGKRFGDCDRSSPCCGRDDPCDRKPCEDR
jgi:putative FmdB family regulatory protein